MAGQDTPQGKGRKEAVAGLGTVWESRELEEMAKEIPPKQPCGIQDFTKT